MRENRGALQEQEAVRCLTCGYDVRGLAAGVCPECGAVVTQAVRDTALARNAFLRETPRMATRRLIVFGVVAAIIVVGSARGNVALGLWASGWLVATLGPALWICGRTTDARTRMVALLWMREFPLLHSCWLVGWAAAGVAQLVANDAMTMVAGIGSFVLYVLCLALWSISTHFWDHRLRLELKGVPDKRLTIYLTLGMGVILLSGGLCGAGMLGAVWE